MSWRKHFGVKTRNKNKYHITRESNMVAEHRLSLAY